MNLTARDILIFLAAWLAFTGLALAKLRYERRTRGVRTDTGLVGVGFRSAVLLIVFYVVFFLLLGLSIATTLLLFGFVSGILLAMRLTTQTDFFGGDDVVSMTIALSIFVPLYITQQFIFGFPDHDEVILSPPHDAPPTSEIRPAMIGGSPASMAAVATSTIAEDELVGATGTVVGMLRPAGKIEIDGRAYSARTSDGRILDAGTAVEICGRRDGQLLVREITAIG